MFQKDDILKVEVGIRSHVTKPYYVLVVHGGATFFETTIPGVSNRSWDMESPEWSYYHCNRCKKVGTFKTHGHLLYNQELRLNGKTIYSADNPRGAKPTDTDSIK